jgi:DNA-binding NarL/FixJ family response regulator
MKDEGGPERLRILVSDGQGHRLDEVLQTVTLLGHEVVGQTALGEVAAASASVRPDAAIVIVGEGSERALDLIGRIVTDAACPVIAILDVEDEAFIRDAAKRGIFAYIAGRLAPAIHSRRRTLVAEHGRRHACPNPATGTPGSSRSSARTAAGSAGTSTAPRC